MFPSLEDAEDALQDAFVRMWPHAADIATSSDAEALTVTTLRHLSIDRHRSSHATQPLTPEHDARLAADAGNAVEARVVLAEVEQMMCQLLSPLQQDILRMREYEGRSYAEIATALDMKETAVRMQLSRARRALREEYRKRNTI